MGRGGGGESAIGSSGSLDSSRVSSRGSASPRGWRAWCSGASKLFEAIVHRLAGGDRVEGFERFADGVVRRPGVLRGKGVDQFCRHGVRRRLEEAAGMEL